jgi:transcriptional regulator GlxA family with amidase domain
MLLSTTDAAVSEVGAAVGWPDPSHFSRRFRSQMGVSPRTYRAMSHRHYAARRATPEPPAEEG